MIRGWFSRRMRSGPNRIAPATELWARGLAQWECGDLTAAADHLGRAIAAHPDRADWRNELGLLWLKAGAPERAAGEFEAALAIDPGLAQAHCNLGIVARQRGDTRLALVSFERARELNPTLLEAHFNCGLLLREIDLPDQAIACFERTLELDPGHVEAHRSLACALQDLGRFDAARVSFERALAIRPDHHEARLSKAFLHLLCGDFRAGWLDYAARFATEESPRRPFPFPDWDGGSLEGKTLLVYAEQGLGDEILFAGCVPDLIAKARHVVIDCEPRLAALFARSFPSATVHGGARDADHAWLNGVPTPDLKVAAGSVPGFLRNAPTDFPARDHYLLADPVRVDHWRQRLASLGPGLKVGIAWRGGLPQTRAARRSFALADLLPILSDPGCRFVSLQYTDCAAEIKALLQSAGVRVHNWQEAIDDYDETAALVTSLDLVISVQTAVVHLAGALGKPAWVLVPAVAEWRYLQSGDTMPWYSSVRLFRQREAGQWQPVVTEIAAELARRMGREDSKMNRPAQWTAI